MAALQKLKQNTLVLMAVIVLAKLVGMARDVVLANYFGTSNVSDAYLIAVSVPTLLFYFVGHALSTAYLPMFNKLKSESGEKAAINYSNNLMLVALMICALLVLILVVFPSSVAKVFAAGFDDETMLLTARFIRYSAGCLFLMTMLNIFGGFLQAKSNFIIPAAVSLPRNLVLIVTIIIAAGTNVNFLGVGILLAYVAEILLILPFTIKNGYSFKTKLDFRSKEMKETLYVVLPIILGVGVSQINKVIDKSIASTVITGGISALSYASIINNAVQEVLVTGIITILFARCSAWVADGQHELVKEKLSETIQTLSFLLIPASFGVIGVSRLIVKCILSRGAFDEASVRLTAGALCCYTVGLSFLAVRDTLVKVFYAYKETKITTATSILAIVVNIVLNLILSRFWGINGLAFATSMAAVVQCVILYGVLRKKIGDYGLLIQLSSCIRMIIAGAIMFMGLKAVVSLVSRLGGSELTQLMAGIVSGCVIYALSVLVLRVPVAVKLTGTIRSKLLKKA